MSSDLQLNSQFQFFQKEIQGHKRQMDAHKMKYLKQNQVKVYNCTFELELFELRIFLRFPCKFFVEWKTSSGNKQAKTLGFIQNIDGKVNFNQKISLQVQMLYDQSKSLWIRKDSIINVYLITKNKPDFNQLAGRINIDLSMACENNPYKKPLIQSLTYSSTSADLRFALNMKYSLQSKKSASQLDLLEFNDRLYLVKQNDNLNKSKSVDYLKNMQHMVSPVYQIQQSPINTINQNQNQIKPFHFPVSKLQSFGHQVHQLASLQSDRQSQVQPEFCPRMTLGNDKKIISRQDYQSLIQQQSKGMKKSNLIVIPDMKKSRVSDQQSQINTDPDKKTSQGDFTTNKMSDFVKDSPLKKVVSQKQMQKRQKSPQSDIDIVVDLSQITQSKDTIEDKNMKTSMNSSKSFSISRFKAQFQNSGPQNFNRTKSPKQSITSLQMPTLKTNAISANSDHDINTIVQKYEASKNRIKQLETDVSQLVKMLTNTRQKAQKLQQQKVQNLNTIQDLMYDNSQLHKKVDQFQQKFNYESKINSIHCQKLKMMSSQLTVQKSRSSKSGNISHHGADYHKLQAQIYHLREDIKKLNYDKANVQQKLYKRDQIQLQNQILIQQLQQELTKYRTQRLDSAPKLSPSALQLQSKINKQPANSKLSQNELKQQEYISFLQQNLQNIQRQNIEIKNICNQAHKNLQIYFQRDQRMKQNLNIVEKQFQVVVNLLISKQKLLKQKATQVQGWKKKSYTAAYNASAINQLKQKTIQQDLKKKDQMLQFCQNQIHILEQQLTKMQCQNKQLKEIHNKLLRQSFRYQGDLKVIKQQQSYRQSLASNQAFRLSFPSSRLNIKQQNSVALYKQSIQAFYNKNNILQNFQIQFTAQHHDLRKKAFDQLERSAKIINYLLDQNNCLKLEASDKLIQKQKINQELQLRIQQMQFKIDQLQQQQKISAGSSNITPYTANNFNKPCQDQKVDQFSQATKKRPPINLNTESKMARQVQKLKSIIYDKNKQMSDLIASYQKLKLQNETQSMLLKTKKVQIQRRASRNDQDESDAELVHDILDLQIRLNKEKQHKNQIMQELSLQKSLNKSQQISQYQQFDISQTYKQIRAIITSRQNFITTQQSLKRLVSKINHLQQASQRVDKDYKLMYLVEQNSRSISKQLQILKSALFKLNFKDIQPFQYKSMIANICKPSQSALHNLLTAVEEMVNTYG